MAVEFSTKNRQRREKLKKIYVYDGISQLFNGKYIISWTADDYKG